MIKAPKTIAVACRLDLESARVLEELAERKGLTRSDFLRGVVEKILVPARDEAEAMTAALSALPPGARQKATRAVEIQKRLRELRAARPKTNLLSSLFQDGDGVAQDGETRGLEVELAVLKKSFEADVVGAAALCDEGRGGGLPVLRTVPMPPANEEEVDEEEVEKTDAEKEADEEEVDEEEVEKTDAEKKADRFLEITGLINSLRGCRVKRSWLDNYMDGGPSVCDLLIQELELGRGAAVLDEELFEKLRDAAVRAVELRGKIQELAAAEPSKVAGPLVKELEAELSALRADVLADVVAAAEKRKGSAKKSGSFWDDLPGW